MIYLKLADWVVGLSVEPPSLAAALAERYAAFACDDGDPDLSVTLAHEPGGDDGESILQGGLRAKGEDYLLDGAQFYGMIGPFRGQALLRLRSSNATREVEYFLRVTLALFAWVRGGLLVHSAALKVGQGAFLFTGQSGSGKSTVVSLSRGRQQTTALSDDLVVIRPDGGMWRAYGTPFWNFRPESLPPEGREGQTSSGPIRAIYKLVQDRDVFVEPMSSAAAAAELLANCPIVNSQPALAQDLLLRCRDVAKAVGMQRLHFRKDDAFWDIISC
jgi:hypothetical protein